MLPAAAVLSLFNRSHKSVKFLCNLMSLVTCGAANQFLNILRSRTVSQIQHRVDVDSIKVHSHS